MKAISVIKIALKASLILWYAFTETLQEASVGKALGVIWFLVVVGGTLFWWGLG